MTNLDNESLNYNKSSKIVDKVSTSNKEIQVNPESKPTKVYIDRSWSAKCLTTRIMKAKPKSTAEVSVNTEERFSTYRHPQSHGESDTSNVNTPSNMMSDNSTKLRLFKKYDDSN